MIEILTLLTGIFLAQASPGPSMMAVASVSLGSGRLAGIAASAGIATGVIVWCLLFAFGIGSLLIAYPAAMIFAKLIGGGYLLYLGVKSLKSSFAQRSHGPKSDREEMSVSDAYRRGLFVVMTNPKAALLWVAITLFLTSSSLYVPLYLLVGVLAAASAFFIYGAYAWLFSTGVAVRSYEKSFRIVDASFGTIFALLGGKLVFDAVKETLSP